MAHVCNALFIRFTEKKLDYAWPPYWNSINTIKLYPSTACQKKKDRQICKIQRFLMPKKCDTEQVNMGKQS